MGFMEGEEPTIRIYTERGSMNRPLRVVDGSSGKSSPAWTADGWCVARLAAQAVPVEFGLNRAYPNPFNGQLRIEFTLGTGGTANLKAYDLTGREVADIVSGEYQAGSHAKSWNAVDLPSGIYIIRLTSDDRSQAVKVALVK